MGTRNVIVGVIWLAAAGLAFLAIVWIFQRRLVYFPQTRQVPSATTVVTGGENISFETADRVRLGGWFVRPAGETPIGTILVFNGNAGNRLDRAPFAEALRARGFSVLLFDYRGYGGNAGHPTEEGLAEDARAARAYLESRGDVDTRRIAYFGESLGAAVAVALAVDHPPSALVLRSPFTTLADAGAYHYPFLPVRWLLRDRYDSLARVGLLRAPLLVIAGELDRVIPWEQSRRLFDAATVERRFVLIAGVDHNDHGLMAGEQIILEISGFLAGRTSVEAPRPS